MPTTINQSMTDKKIHQPLEYIPPEILCAKDYEDIAGHFIEPSRLAYIAGGSGHDRTLKLNRQAFSGYAITPRLLCDVSDASCQTYLFGKLLPHPILLAPVAFQEMVHEKAELATAKGAYASESTMIASTLSSRSLEQISQASIHSKWFQLYIQPKEEDTDALIQRAKESGYEAIVVTVDAAVQAPSFQAMRSGFDLPDAIKAANLKHQTPVNPPQPKERQSRVFLSFMQQAVTKVKLLKIIQESGLPVIVKGVLNPQDALELKNLGAAAVIVSNHGGRTLDGAPSSLSVLPQIRQTVGKDYPVLFDSGIRSGDDIFKAIALGADLVLVGRLQMYALSVAGSLGVAHMIRLLKEELELTMAMAGCTNLTEIKATSLHRLK